MRPDALLSRGAVQKKLLKKASVCSKFELVNLPVSNSLLTELEMSRKQHLRSILFIYKVTALVKNEI